MLHSSNPTLNDNTFAGFGSIQTANAMTIQGTVIKTAVLLSLVIAAAGWTWYIAAQAASAAGTAEAALGAASPYIFVGIIGGLITALITVFAKKASPVTAPIYALFEGLFLGGFSAYINLRYPGVAMQAVIATFAVMLMMLVLYTMRIIPVTEKFKMGVAAATGGIFLFYLIAFVLGFFGISVGVLQFDSSGLISIGFSVLVIIIAALNLVMDFDMIEQGANQGAPKYMEWYGAFGLLVTLIWLYIEILRLLSKLRSR